MEPVDKSLGWASADALEAYLKRADRFIIYTHAAKTRMTILVVFVCYLLIFGFFLNFMSERFEALDELPKFLALAKDSGTNKTLFYASGSCGFLLAVGILLYFMWYVVDIWGLQVWASDRELRVQNTITDPLFRRLMGTGTLLMEEIVQLRGGRSATRVSDGKNRVRFSPVDQVDSLIETIIKNAPKLRDLGCNDRSS